MSETAIKHSSADQKRPIVLIVGAHSDSTTGMAKQLIDAQHSVVMCSGPPGCALLRGDRCILVDVADAVVFAARGPGNRSTDIALSRCANAARCAVVVDGSPSVGWPLGAIHVAADDTDGVVQGLTRREG